jgi:predicted lysophospholipase L1 biosynthesis ABC-type transport system permease subunit
VPLVEDFDGFSWNGEYGNFLALGRLQPGATAGGAQAQLQTILGQIIDEEMPPKERSFAHDAIKAYVQPLQEAVVGQSGPTLWLLMSAVLGLLLIACVNLANAQVGRALSREREAAVRSALGASKRQLLWSSLAESLALATIGGVLGVVLAREALELFRAHAPIQLPRASEIHLNGTVLLFSVALTIGAALLFGAMPALKWLASDPQNALQRRERQSSGQPAESEGTQLADRVASVCVYGLAAGDGVVCQEFVAFAEQR